MTVRPQERILAALAVLVLLGGVVDVALVRGAGSATVRRAPAVVAPVLPGGVASALGARTGFSPGAGIGFAPREEVERDLDALVASGARWLRVDLDWSVLEPQDGRFDWTAADRVVGQARARGLSVLALPTYTPEWARPAGTGSHHAPDDPARFAAFVAAAAERFVPQGVLHYEVWNEPNLPQFWEPRADPAAYVTLLRLTAERVRAVAPQAVLLSGGLAPAADDEVRGSVDPRTFVQRMYALGAAAWFDALAIHPYGFPALPSEPAGGFNLWQQLPQVRRTMEAAGDGGTQVWLTEVGAPTYGGPGGVSQDRQAEVVRQAVRLSAALPWAGPVFLYALRDTGSDPDDREDHFGLLREDGTPKPAYAVLQRELA